MNFKDKWEVDENGQQFLFTVRMQRRLSQAGLPIEPAYLKELKDTPPQRDYQKSERPEYQDKPRRQAAPVRKKTTFAMPATIQIDPKTGKYIGCMKWYNAQKGYGFLIRGANEEIFFHKSSVIGNPTELNEGQWVLYDMEETTKGPEAAEIEPYEGDVDSLLT